MSDEEWSEDDSETYQSLSHYAVPERERQIAIAVALVQSSDAPGGILDLCSGEGLMTQALGVACPEAELFAYDGSASMLATARRRVGERMRGRTWHLVPGRSGPELRGGHAGDPSCAC